MKRTLVIVVALVAAGCASGAVYSASETNAAIRVGTCNVRVAAKKDIEMGNGWNDRKADLICDVFGNQFLPQVLFEELSITEINALLNAIVSGK